MNYSVDIFQMKMRPWLYFFSFFLSRNNFKHLPMKQSVFSLQHTHVSAAADLIACFVAAVSLLVSLSFFFFSFFFNHAARRRPARRWLASAKHKQSPTIDTSETKKKKKKVRRHEKRAWRFNVFLKRSRKQRFLRFPLRRWCHRSSPAKEGGTCFLGKGFDCGRRRCSQHVGAAAGQSIPRYDTTPPLRAHRSILTQ